MLFQFKTFFRVCRCSDDYSWH